MIESIRRKSAFVDLVHKLSWSSPAGLKVSGIFIGASFGANCETTVSRGHTFLIGLAAIVDLSAEGLKHVAGAKAAIARIVTRPLDIIFSFQVLASAKTAEVKS
jgi:hypothetical protein